MDSCDIRNNYYYTYTKHAHVKRLYTAGILGNWIDEASGLVYIEQQQMCKWAAKTHHEKATIFAALCMTVDMLCKYVGLSICIMQNYKIGGTNFTGQVQSYHADTYSFTVDKRQHHSQSEQLPPAAVELHLTVVDTVTSFSSARTI